jgi:hypothetical protein
MHFAQNRNWDAICLQKLNFGLISCVSDIASGLLPCWSAGHGLSGGGGTSTLDASQTDAAGISITSELQFCVTASHI